MASELQRLVDNLGERLGRSVAIDDQNIRLLAYNSHSGDVDDARIESIMRREVPRELVDYDHAIGLYEAGGLFQMPARPELGLTIERLAMPIRYDGRLLGFLWLLGSEGELDDDDLETVRLAADHAAQILHREHLLDELRLARVREHTRDLLSGNPQLRHDAAQRLIEEELLITGPAVCMVVTIPHETEQPLSDKDRLALAVGLENGCRRAPPRTAVHMERVDHGVVLLVHAADSFAREIDDLAAAIQEQVCAATGCTREECHIGIGDHRPGLEETYDSYLEARRTVDVARIIRVLGAIVKYSDLGVYGMLAELPARPLHRSIHPGLQRLLEYDASNNTALVPTLETFLNNAGNVKRTAESLKVHRASVHYRLQRIEEIAKVDLSDGDDHLALHLGLKVAKLVDLR